MLLKHLQKYVGNTCNICVKTYATSREPHLQYVSDQTDETLKTEACYIRVQPLQHMKHRGLLFQHPYENTCNKPMKHLKHLKHMLATYVFHPSFRRRKAE
jgi:SUMO ligase MMS21 Smc5/6 complex component